MHIYSMLSVKNKLQNKLKSNNNTESDKLSSLPAYENELNISVIMPHVLGYLSRIAAFIVLAGIA